VRECMCDVRHVVKPIDMVAIEESSLQPVRGG
jgi:hypothetical protein